MREGIRQLLLWIWPRLRRVYADYGMELSLRDMLAAPGAHRAMTDPHQARNTGVPGAHVWLLAALALGSLFVPMVRAQQGGQTSSTPPLTGAVAPAGNCGVGALYVNTTTGDLYDCNAGAWNKVNGGGSGTGFNGLLGSSFQDATEIAAPSNPGSGNDRLYLDSTAHTLKCLTSSGGNCMPSTAGVAWSGVTNGANSNAGSFSANGNSWDWTGTTIFKLRSGAGLASSANGDLGFDTTNNNWHLWNGADRIAALFEGSVTNTDCAKIGVTSSRQSIQDNGGPCAQTIANATSKWLNSYNAATGVFTQTQPNITDVINGCNTTGGVSGQVYESNGSGCGGYADPIVSGPDAPGAAPTKNPVQIGLFDGTNVQRVLGSSAGRLSVDINTAPTISVTGTFFQSTQPVSCTAANCPVNVAQFGGTNVVTGTGASGSGIPRVTLSNDSSLAANQSVNEAQRGGTNIVADPCLANTKSYVSINQTANAQLVSGTTSKKIYPCSIHVVTAAAQNVALVEGTGSTCGTGTAGVPGFGGATAATGWNFAANGGIAYGDGSSALGAEGTAADNLCLFQSGTGQVSGGLSYVVQ